MQNPYAGAQNIGHQLGRALGNVFFGGGQAAQAEAERQARRELLDQQLIEAKLAHLLGQTELTQASTQEKRQAAEAAAESTRFQQKMQNQIFNAVLANDINAANLSNTMLKPGNTYDPFKPIGNTGYGINTATGAGMIASPELARMNEQTNNAAIARDRAAAANSYASAANARARTETERFNLQHLQKHGHKAGDEPQLSNTHMRFFQKTINGINGPENIHDTAKFGAYTQWAYMNDLDPNHPKTFRAWNMDLLLNAAQAPATPAAPQRGGVLQMDLSDIPY